ncbi:MAG: U32 family peptidase [Lachnospiraceae bacterium]|nr:U32 family peptidase [Lachnospiraceae bacterium]
MARKRPLELLAPAGSPESLRAALYSGADAVYMGGRAFGARAYAVNASDDELPELLDLMHFHGKKLYLTVNILLREKELFGEVYDFMAPLYEAGLDAAIIQDVGLFDFFRKEFPGLPLHVSTQMSAAGPASARAFQAAGASRIVLPRELSLTEIRAVADAADLEIECFAQGALCYGYSGQCLFSGMVGGRSGNRGRCAQSCRLPYEVWRGSERLSKPDAPYVMNLKDNCALDVLPQMIAAGITSYKLEGRMKSPAYTAGVTAIYRKYLNMAMTDPEHYRVDDADRRALTSLFDRGGFTKTWFTMHNSTDMVCPKERDPGRTPDDSFLKAAQERERGADPSFLRPVDMHLILEPGKKVSLQATDVRTRRTCAASGPEAGFAENRPVSLADAEKQCRKAGGSGFTVVNVTQENSEQAFVPLREINDLRRQVLDGLRAQIVGAAKRSLPVQP